MFAWLKRKAFEVVTPPPPMPIIPGEEYTMHVGNPFQDDPKARVVAVDKGWVQYQFVMGDALSSFQHTAGEILSALLQAYSTSVAP